MGNTWTVLAWKNVNGTYCYIQVYAGESRAAAMRAARKEKEAGCDRVRIEWR
jgi:hypothetical protein